MTRLTAADLRVKVFADGADRASMLAFYANPVVKGFTTNPTLMRQAGVSDYVAFAKGILEAIPDRPISFEVFSDEFDEMEAQAREIATWGPNVYAKIPVQNTRGESACPMLRRLGGSGVKVNVTAIFTQAQLDAASDALADAAPCNLSVFAGRVADTGRDPLDLMRHSVAKARDAGPHQEIIWASPREVLNVVQAHEMGCHIITVSPDILKKLDQLGRDVDDLALDAVKIFRRDALAAGFSIP